MFFMLNMDKGLLGPVWNGWLVGVLVVRLRHWAEQWPNDDLQLCSSSCALRCQHGWELLGQWMEQCMALEDGCQHSMDDGGTQNALLEKGFEGKENIRITDFQDSHILFFV
uniref:Uncharacterized protein n=1 Tax=Meloidogyne enterolobii TaxID=390850 RepID=A0A6V7X9K8_MELEN|nr:unnamed protein product [Meloidogyne enterolobii]